MQYHVYVFYFVAIFCTLGVYSVYSADLGSLPDIAADLGITIPKGLATVKFGEKTIELGQEISPATSQELPVLEWPSEGGNFYTLIFIDPDNPKEISNQMIHWLLVNIPNNQVANGVELMKYFGATPPSHHPAHRFVFYIFKQKGQLEPNAYNQFTDEIKGNMLLRCHTDIKDIIQKLDLGDIVGSHYFMSAPDDESPRFLYEAAQKFGFVFKL